MRHACARGAGDTVWVTVWTGATSPPDRLSTWVKRGDLLVARGQHDGVGKREVVGGSHGSSL